MFLLIVAFFLSAPLAAQAPAADSPQVLACKLSALAQRCTGVAFTLKPKSIEADRLFLIATACGRAADELKSATIATASPVSARLSILLSQARAYNGTATRGTLALTPLSPRQEVVPMLLPELIDLIEKEDVDVHLRLTPWQLTVKRILFRLVVELFYGFGNKYHESQQEVKQLKCLARMFNKPWSPERKLQYLALRLQKRKAPLSPTVQAAPFSFGTYFGTLQKKAYGTFIKQHPWLLLRTLRLLGDGLIDKIIPNPHQPKWQMYVELLLPLILARGIVHVLSYDRSETATDLAYTIGTDSLMYLAYSHFYFDEGTPGYAVANILYWLMPFLLETTSTRLWRAHSDKPLGKRAAAFLRDGKTHINAILAEGISISLIYKLLDDVLFPLIPIPDWLVESTVRPLPATPITEKDADEQRAILG